MHIFDPYLSDVSYSPTYPSCLRRLLRISADSGIYIKTKQTKIKHEQKQIKSQQYTKFYSNQLIFFFFFF